ncbi:MAG: energy transducer TonB [Saprospiraceae bacterium]|nr:energy transducer TonB [Saprospiraceae bacterium]
MISGIEFTNGGMMWFSVFFMMAIATVILGMRWYMSKKEKQNLADLNKDTKFKSPLDARTKYPQVDVFRYSQTIWLLSLAFAVGILVAAFNWTTYDDDIYIPDYDLALEEDIQVEPPRSTVEPPPPPPPPPSVIQEVPDELILEDDTPDFIDQSIDMETSIDNAPVASNEPKTVAPPPPPPPPPPAVKEIFKVVEEMPRFVGCEDLAGDAKEKKACADRKMLEFIYKNIKYPKIARENGVEGMVVVRFVVEPDGSISNPEIVRDIGAGCGDEALRIVNMMPEWIPGKQRGTKVRVQFNLPVRFDLVDQS